MLSKRFQIAALFAAFLLFLVASCSPAYAFQLRYASNGMLLADYGSATAMRFPATVTSGSGVMNVVGSGSLALASGGSAAITAGATISKAAIWDGIAAAASASGALLGGPAGLALFGTAAMIDYLSSNNTTWDPGTTPGRPFKQSITTQTPTSNVCYGISAWAFCTYPTPAAACSAWAASYPTTGTIVGQYCRWATGFQTTWYTSTTPGTVTNVINAYKTIEEIRAEMVGIPVLPRPDLVQQLTQAVPDGLTTSTPTLSGPTTAVGTPTVVVQVKSETVIDPASGKPVTRTTTTTTTKQKTSAITYPNGSPVEVVTEQTTVKTDTAQPVLNPDGTPKLDAQGHPVINTSTSTGTSNAQGDPITPESDLCKQHPDISACEVVKATDTALPGQPVLYTRKYPQGITGVYDEKIAAIKATPLMNLTSQLAPNLGDSHGCPVWQLPLNMGIVNFGIQDVSLPCNVWAFMRVVMIIGSLFLARALIFGG